MDDVLLLEHLELVWSYEAWLLLRRQPRLGSLTLWFGDLGWTTTPYPHEIGPAPFHLDTLKLVGRSVAIPRTHFRLLTQASTSALRFLRVTIPAYEPPDDEDNDPDGSGFVWDFSQLKGLSHLWMDYEYSFLDLKYLRTVTSCPWISCLTLSMYGEMGYADSDYDYEEPWTALEDLPLVKPDASLSLTSYSSLQILAYAIRQDCFLKTDDRGSAKAFVRWCSQHAYSAVEFDDSYEYII
ncbi:hypothetical protein NBRC10513v2_001510 [Rhodotorula toruloides]